MGSRRTRRVSGRFLGLAAVLVLFLPLQVQADSNEGGLTGIIEAYQVVVNDDGMERLLPAEKARPKDIIEYKLTYKNNGNTPLQNIVITDPVPSEAVYIAESAYLPREGSVRFSIDEGRSYHEWPVKVLIETADGEQVWKDATPEQVTHIRWTLDEAIDPDQGVVVSYRASVK
jgi:uncharacterized repeat protein (TIGR01451 family)